MCDTKRSGSARRATLRSDTESAILLPGQLLPHDGTGHAALSCQDASECCQHTQFTAKTGRACLAGANDASCMTRGGTRHAASSRLARARRCLMNNVTTELSSSSSASLQHAALWSSLATHLAHLHSRVSGGARYRPGADAPLPAQRRGAWSRAERWQGVRRKPLRAGARLSAACRPV